MEAPARSRDAGREPNPSAISAGDEAVQRFTRQFRRAVTDHANFRPKAIANAMRATGVDLSDQQAVDAWIADFSALPKESRDEFSGTFPCRVTPTSPSALRSLLATRRQSGSGATQPSTFRSGT